MSGITDLKVSLTVQSMTTSVVTVVGVVLVDIDGHVVNRQLKCHMLNTTCVLMITSVVIYVDVVLVDI